MSATNNRFHEVSYNSGKRVSGSDIEFEKTRPAHLIAESDNVRASIPISLLAFFPCFHYSIVAQTSFCLAHAYQKSRAMHMVKQKPLRPIFLQTKTTISRNVPQENNSSANSQKALGHVVKIKAHLAVK